MSKKVQPLICIVDPNQGYREQLYQQLAAKGIYNILEFEDGETCYVSSSETSADIVISDYNLGDSNWNGLEFMEEYRILYEHTKFIFMASNTGIELAVDSVKKGATDYIVKSKPGTDRLIQHIENFCDCFKQNQKGKYQVDC